MEILIGREPGKDNARLALTCAGKTAYAAGPVPKTVSRNHLRLIIGSNPDDITVENVSENNLVYVDGLDVLRLSGVSAAARIELGSDRFPIEVKAVIRLFSSQQSFEISHLRAVEEHFRQARKDHQVKQARFNALSTITPILTMGSVAVGFIIKDESMAALRTAMYVLAAVLMLVFFIIRWINAKRAPEQLQAIEEEYQKQYVCPNPSCHSFFGAGLRYEQLRKQGKCPYCNARLIGK